MRKTQNVIAGFAILNNGKLTPTGWGSLVVLLVVIGAAYFYVWKRK